MSKQIYIYALPTDIERLIYILKTEVGLSIISSVSTKPEPKWVTSPMQDGSVLQSNSSVSASCCLVPNGLADIRMKHISYQTKWHVEEESEIIRVSGFDYDGKILVRGRLYCQTDALAGIEIVKKRADFIRWTDRIFRKTKQHLQLSKQYGSYMGYDAMVWKEGGGKLASLAFPGRNPILEPV